MASEQAKVLEELPIFPLSTVLFPGAVLPLHIFEERYKAMMRYAIENSGQFGISFRDDASVGGETQPEVGSVGCAAKIYAVMPLEEGKMNVLSTGLVRYRIVEFKQIVPFLIARIETFGDDTEDESDLTRLYGDTRELAQKFLESVRSLADSNPTAALELPEEAEAFSLFVASALPVDDESKQALLEITSTKGRLVRLRHYLINTLSTYTDRLRLHDLAKRNGHGKRPPA
jgi:Lon protease-like protein